MRSTRPIRSIRSTRSTKLIRSIRSTSFIRPIRSMRPISAMRPTQLTRPLSFFRPIRSPGTRAPGTQAPGTRHPAPGTWHPAPCAGNRIGSKLSSKVLTLPGSSRTPTEHTLIGEYSNRMLGLVPFEDP